MKQRATIVIQWSKVPPSYADRRKVLFDAWYEGLLKLGDQMFEELADWPGPDPERLPDGSWPPPPGCPTAEELKDSDDPWDQLMCIVLRGAKKETPPKITFRRRRRGPDGARRGRSRRDCCFAIYFTTNTPSTRLLRRASTARRF